jgi:hypothetical protein
MKTISSEKKSCRPEVQRWWSQYCSSWFFWQHARLQSWYKGERSLIWNYHIISTALKMQEVKFLYLLEEIELCSITVFLLTWWCPFLFWGTGDPVWWSIGAYVDNGSYGSPLSWRRFNPWAVHMKLFKGSFFILKLSYSLWICQIFSMFEWDCI